MKANQLTRGSKRRLMYVESKSGLIGGAPARIGWVTFSQSGRSIYYLGLQLSRIKGGGVRGNFMDVESGSEFWVSGVKRSGSNAHPSERSLAVEVDPDAMGAYEAHRAEGGV